jgi:hypothetical protein
MHSHAGDLLCQIWHTLIVFSSDSLNMALPVAGEVRPRFWFIARPLRRLACPPFHRRRLFSPANLPRSRYAPARWVRNDNPPQVLAFVRHGPGRRDLHIDLCGSPWRMGSGGQRPNRRGRWVAGVRLLWAASAAAFLCDRAAHRSLAGLAAFEISTSHRALSSRQRQRQCRLQTTTPILQAW